MNNNSFKKNISYLNIITIWALVLISINKDSKFSDRINRSIASMPTIRIDGEETFSIGIKSFLNTEQMLNFKYNQEDNSSIKSTEFSPEKNPKFPLAYYLIPEGEIDFIFADSLDPQVAGQMSLKISGKRHFKFFIHPESEEYYNFLLSSYNYIDANRTEFWASPTSNDKTLLVWNKNNDQRTPFIAKISMEKMIKKVNPLIAHQQVARAIANQKALDRLGRDKLEKIKLKFFTESMGLSFKRTDNQILKIGGQIISEMPKEIIDNQKRWISFSALMSGFKNPAPKMMEVIKKSNLSTLEFFNVYMIDGFLKILEEFSFKQGFTFSPHAHNLLLETNLDFTPTGFWVIRDLERIVPDIMAMAKNKGPVDVYFERFNNAKFKFLQGQANQIISYVYYYKLQVFDFILNQVSKLDPSIGAIEKQQLSDLIDQKFTKLVNRYYHLNLTSPPTLNNYQAVVDKMIRQSKLSNDIQKKPIADCFSLQAFIGHKKIQQEWTEIYLAAPPYQYFLTDHALYQLSENSISGFGVFSDIEFDDYRNNNKTLPILLKYQIRPKKVSACLSETIQLLPTLAQ